MAEQASAPHNKRASFRNLAAIIIIILLIGGGIALAYVSVSKQTTKEQYFTAEKDSIDLYVDTFKKRYQTELDWTDYAKKNATETDLKFSLKPNDMFQDTDIGMGIDLSDIVDHSSLLLTIQKDDKAEKLATNFELDFAGMKIDDIAFYLTDDAMMLGLPFLDETLKMSFQDLSDKIAETDPDIEADTVKDFFDKLFSRDLGLLAKEDKAYFEKEYLDLIYDELPEDAFSTTEDEVEVNGKSMTSEKIEMHLEEDTIKDILDILLDKLQSEERIIDILERQLAATMMDDSEWAMFTNEFQAGVADIKEAVNTLHMPEGLTSTIWLDDDKIIKRDFNFTFGPDENTLVTLSIEGDQLFEKETQIFDYTYTVEDEFENHGFSISGDLFWDGKQIEDTVEIDATDLNLTYTAEEQVDKKDREFKRDFYVTDEYNDTFGLAWSGEAAYEKDNMSSQHTFSMHDPFEDEPLALQVEVDSKRIKGIDLPQENIKDLGEMSDTELVNYFERDVSKQFEQWLTKLVGFPGGF